MRTGFSFDKPTESKKPEKGSDISFKIREYLKSTEALPQNDTTQVNVGNSRNPESLVIIKPAEIKEQEASKKLSTKVLNGEVFSNDIALTPNTKDSSIDRQFDATSFTNYFRDNIAIKNNNEPTLNGLLNGHSTPVIDYTLQELKTAIRQFII